MFKNICIIGAGNIGSRHLQALSKITLPLSIQVIDPSFDSLTPAKQRYEEVKIHSKHQLEYLQNLNRIHPEIDVAIIATNSNIRFSVTEELLNKSNVRYIIFEKILFDKKIQYTEMAKLLAQKKCKAWVNCSMRTDPFYSGLKKQFESLPITYLVHGSNHGLITNAIHYIDHIAYLTNCYDFTIDTSQLDPKPVQSKRKGFLELNRTLIIKFNDGSYGYFICYPTGNAPFTIEILAEKYHCLMKPLENAVITSNSKSNWIWKKQKITFLYQSQMTNPVISSLLQTSSCQLTPFDISAKMHLNLLESILNFLNSHSNQKTDYYPFT